LDSSTKLIISSKPVIVCKSPNKEKQAKLDKNDFPENREKFLLPGYKHNTDLRAGESRE